MRNAVARIDDDFDDAPVKRKSSSPRAKGGAKTKKKSRIGFDVTRVARYAAFGMSATVLLGIVVNALMLQKGPHPAPLFGKAMALNSASAAPPRAPAPVRTAAAAPGQNSAPEVTASLPPAKDDDEADRAVDDPIGRLLSGQPVKSAPVKANSAMKTEGKTVLGVQKALAKLGFAVKPNGTMNPATRKAIEAFEKDHHLPVKGDLSKRLVKVLSAESGSKID